MPKITIEITDQELKDLKIVRNYFGEHDVTMLEHFAYSFLDNLHKKLCAGETLNDESALPIPVLAPVYRYDVRCDKCGRFINSKEFKKKGGASECFVPDSEVSTEEISYRCKKCTKKHGIAKAYQSVRHDLTSWIH